VPKLVLTSLKILFLVLLYLFIARAIRVIYLDLVGPRVPKPRRAPAPRPAKPRGQPRALVVTEDGAAARTYPLKGEPMVIGRGETCEIALKDTYVSHVHTRIFPREESWFVEDLGSTNGTYLNRAKVTEPTPVAPGDEVRVGKTVVEVRR
jgi:pSer/pThr/pTyr-binding forkhead associated (FHA) protein